MYPKPKKSLGQNFLVDGNIRRKIIEHCDLRGTDIVLEIGAGRGELTRFIAPRVKKVYAFEIDAGLCGILAANFGSDKKVAVIHQDILKARLEKYLVADKAKVIGNIPYYITTPIIERLLRYKARIRALYLTVQKDFGKRMVALPGTKEYGAFSCFVRYHTIPHILFSIKKNSFYPPPKVDSCFLKLEFNETPPQKVRDEGHLFRVIRAAFNQRRKTLRNSLKGIVEEDTLGRFFQDYRLNRNARPEELSLADFINLANS